MKYTHFFSFAFALVLLTASCTHAGSTQPTSTLEPTATAIPTSTPIPTATPRPPVAMVGGSLHCFDEPSLEADMVAIIEIGMQVEVVGQSHDNLFWLVKSDEEAGPCWLEARYATVINLDNQGIAKIQATPTATVGPLTTPPVPENFQVEGGCDPVYNEKFTFRLKYFEVMFRLRWDPVEKSTGYTVYKNGQVLANLDASETEFSDIFSFSVKKSDVVIYAIQAHNEVGDSELAETSVNYICKKK